VTDGAPEEPRPSRKGWISVAYNRDIWIPCPPVFPDGMDRESWAANYSQAWWDSTGRKNRKREIRLLAETLAALHEGVYRLLTCHFAFIHLPNPTMSPLMVCYCVWPAAGERESQLRALAHAEDPVAMEPPAVTDFPTDKLGDGLKVSYHQLSGDDGTTIIGNVNYAWRSEEHETDVRLFTSCPDLGRLQGAMPHIDDLARATGVVAVDR
jgi:hypothetical protein